MSAIGESFSLSSYALPKRSPRTESAASTSKVYASHQQASTSNSDGFVTVAAQGDGVHVLDLSTLHPVISHTLGPQSAFSCPAVTRTTRVDDARICTTYVVVDAAQDLCPQESGRTVWMWKDDPAGDEIASEVQKKKFSAIIPHRVSSIYAPDDLPDCILLVGQKGELTSTDSELNHSNTLNQEAGEDSSLVKSFVLPRTSCTFVPTTTTPSQGVIVVLLLRTGDFLSIQVYSVGMNGEIVSVGSCPIPLPKSAIVDASCSTSGFVTTLTPTGTWHSFQLQSSNNNSLSLTIPVEPLHLRSLSFIPASSEPSPFPREASVLSCGSSHVLLAGISYGSSPELIFLLWDLQYAVLLASHTSPVLSNLYRSKKQGVELQLIGGTSSNSQAFLVLSPKTTKQLANGHSELQSPAVDPNARSSILVIPLTVPPTSTIANAMGRASFGAKWISQTVSNGSQIEGGISGDIDAFQAKLLKTIRSAVEQKRVEAADDAFFDWISKEEAKQSQTKDLPNPSTEKDTKLGYQFVRQLMELVLRRPGKGSTDIPYSPRVVRYLLEKRAVSSGVIEGGLFPALRIRKDWESMVIALKTVIDIPEVDIVTFLHDVIVSRQPPPTQTGDEAMQVDSSIPADTTIPPLSIVLPLVVSYPTTVATMRLAIRQHLREADELDVVLKELLGWMERWNSEEERLLPEKVAKDPTGGLIPVYEERKLENIPPLTEILRFLQTILDSSFLTLLTHPPSYPLIQNIFSHLQPELDFNDDLELLRGPLEPFAKAHSKAILEGTVQKVDVKVDWRRRKKAVHEQAGMAVGLYQVEELVL